MVFKVLRVMLRSFQEMCTLLSSRKANSSEPKVTTRNRKFVNLRQNSELQSRSENSTKALKQKIEIGTTQEQVFKILNGEMSSKVKESSFSPYQPLPEIGDMGVIKAHKPKITRQLTYNVLNPVFVKGPINFSNFKSHKVQNNSVNNNGVSYAEVQFKKIDKDMRKVTEVSKKANSNKIKVNKEFIKATENVSEDNHGNSQAFWIEF